MLPGVTEEEAIKISWKVLFNIGRNEIELNKTKCVTSWRSIWAGLFSLIGIFELNFLLQIIEKNALHFI